jgi:hypothetical protein
MVKPGTVSCRIVRCTYSIGRKQISGRSTIDEDIVTLSDTAVEAVKSPIFREIMSVLRPGLITRRRNELPVVAAWSPKPVDREPIWFWLQFWLGLRRLAVHPYVGTRYR